MSRKKKDDGQGRKDARILPTRWRDTILVCRECSRKLRGGFGPEGEIRIEKALKHALPDAGKGRRARLAILPVGCFDICPKNAVIVACGSQADRLHLIPIGMETADIVRALKLEKQEASPSGQHQASAEIRSPASTREDG